jgi:hypothetical protein
VDSLCWFGTGGKIVVRMRRWEAVSDVKVRTVAQGLTNHYHPSHALSLIHPFTELDILAQPTLNRYRPFHRPLSIL